MPPLEIETRNPETRRFSKTEIVESGNSHTLYNHIPEENRKEILFAECRDEGTSIITRVELDPSSSVEPGKMYMIVPGPEPLKEVARLGKDDSFEVTIKKAPFGIPIQHRFTHK